MGMNSRFNLKILKLIFFNLIKFGGKIVRRWSWETFFGCGIRLRNYISTVAIFLLLSSALNFYIRECFGLDINTIYDAIYYTTVSLTTLGYGDITPSKPLGKIVSSIQSVIGLVLFAILASMLFRRVVP